MSGDPRAGDRTPGDDMADDTMREQLTAYALGTADADTRAAVERAIAASPELARELDELTEVSALLALSVTPRTPPAGLRERIMAAAAKSREAGDAAGGAVGDAAGSTRPTRRGPDGPASGAPSLRISSTPQPAPTSAAGRPRGSRWSVGVIAPWLLAAASLAGVVVTGRNLVNERDARRVAEVDASGLRSQVAALDSLVATLTASELSTVTMTSTGSPPSARLYWNRARGEVLLAAFRLPPAPAGRTYQLWGIAEGAAPVSLGTFESAGEGRDVVRFQIPPGLNLAVGAVTEEPAGGSPQPTSTPFLAGTVRATE